MIIGFTGPREGILVKQHDSLRAVVRKLTFTAFIHGGSVGADTLAHYAVRGCNKTCPIFILPADRDQGTIVTVPMGNYNFILQERPPLERNDIMVEVIHGLIAAPYSFSSDNSGTWYTIRRARKKGVPILFVWPDGSMEIEE